jgi:hypothetical protein
VSTTVESDVTTVVVSTDVESVVDSTSVELEPQDASNPTTKKAIAILFIVFYFFYKIYIS